MKKTPGMTTRFKLPPRIRNKRITGGDFKARMALTDRIAELPGIDTIERNDEAVPCRVDIYLRRKSTAGGLKRKPIRLLCSLDRESVTVRRLDRWGRYQVLSNGWGRLVDDRVCVNLPRDRKELESVWRIVLRAYNRLFDPSAPEPGSQTVSTWDWPKFSRTSLQ